MHTILVLLDKPKALAGNLQQDWTNVIAHIRNDVEQSNPSCTSLAEGFWQIVADGTSQDSMMRVLFELGAQLMSCPFPYRVLFFDEEGPKWVHGHQPKN
jgi:hypothetical protein